MAHTQYGIGVTKNRFELFDDEEEDPLEVLKVREQEKEARKKSRLSEKENKGKEPTQTKGKTQLIRKGIKESTQNLKLHDSQKAKEETFKSKYPPRIDRGERRYNGDREERNNRRNKDERPGTEFIPRYYQDYSQYEKREYRGEMRGFLRESGDTRGRGRGGLGGIGRGGISRGGSRGRGQRPAYDNRGKREYERQSGSDKTYYFSGVKPVDKRDGSGAHNWGTHRDDLE
ncbi:hypothetical protein AAG570_013199 [Ranatra chinensis]|uniref:Hyaluronan/mRNA-binding protein domain-containing protein n=1 Tax=Ranatra chinensis TaxID=642074 RepID=A0ABD0YG21_9HEMI